VRGGHPLVLASSNSNVRWELIKSNPNARNATINVLPARLIVIIASASAQEQGPEQWCQLGSSPSASAMLA
jgi:hypothetical protein